MELYPLNIARLHHDEAGQFIVRLLTNAAEHKLDLKKDPVIEAYLNGLLKQSDVFKIALQQIAAQRETEDIARLDVQRDHQFNTLNAQVNVYRHSNEPEEMNAYKIARMIMKNYKKIDKLNYEAETIGLNNLLAEWAKPENKDAVKLLQLQLHLDRLKKAAVIFTEMFDNRSSVTMLKEVFNTKALRIEMTDNYGEFVDYSFAMAKNNKGELYVGLMEAINNGRKYFADLLAKRNGGDGNSNITDNTSEQ